MKGETIKVTTKEEENDPVHEAAPALQPEGEDKELEERRKKEEERKILEKERKEKEAMEIEEKKKNEEEERKRLEKERKEKEEEGLNAESEEKDKEKEQKKEVITLNAGGVKYITFKETVKPILTNSYKYGDEYFIDRDGKLFHFILNHLRY